MCIILSFSYQHLGLNIRSDIQISVIFYNCKAAIYQRTLRWLDKEIPIHNRTTQYAWAFPCMYACICSSIYARGKTWHWIFSCEPFLHGVLGVLGTRLWEQSVPNVSRQLHFPHTNPPVFRRPGNVYIIGYCGRDTTYWRYVDRSTRPLRLHPRLVSWNRVLQHIKYTVWVFMRETTVAINWYSWTQMNK